MKQIHSLDKIKWFCVVHLILFMPFSDMDILNIWNLCLVHNGIIITFFFPCSLHDKFYKIKISCLSSVRRFHIKSRVRFLRSYAFQTGIFQI